MSFFFNNNISAIRPANGLGSKNRPNGKADGKLGSHDVYQISASPQRLPGHERTGAWNRVDSNIEISNERVDIRQLFH